jgi:hypothetical protein
MSGPEQAGRRRRVRSLGRRALIASVVVPVVVVASVLAGALPSHKEAPRPAPSSSSTTVVTAVVPTTTPAVTPPSMTVAAPPPTTTAPAVPAVTSAPTPAPTPSAQPSGYGCVAALAYLGAHAAAGFTFECPGYADGHQAMTCINHAPECPGEQIIVINDPCPAAYMNEAFNSNSWNPATQSFTDGIDPYGYC